MAFFPLMPFGIMSSCTIVLSISSAIIFRKNLKNNFKIRKKLLLINIVFFLIITASILYSVDSKVAIHDIKRDLNLLIFPVIILLFFPQLKLDQFKKIINSYIVATTLLLLLYIIIIINYGIENSHLRSMFDYPYRSIIEGKSHIKITPTYLGLWFSFSVLCLLNKLKEQTKRINKISIVLLASCFYFFIFLIAARMVLVSLTIVLLMLLLYEYKATLTRKLSIIGALVLVLCFVSYGLSNVKLFKKRYYEELFVKKIKEPKGRKPSSLSIRYGIYKCGLGLINESPIFGYGVGDVQEELNKCYKNSYRSSFYKKKKFDTHNFYFNLLLSGGVMALLSFIVMIVFNIKLALNQNDMLYIGFIVLILICCLTENILNRVYGSIFYAFFNALFLLRNIKNIKTC